MTGCLTIRRMPLKEEYQSEVCKMKEAARGSCSPVLRLLETPSYRKFFVADREFPTAMLRSMWTEECGGLYIFNH